jgi:hypothetical protein
MLYKFKSKAAGDLIMLEPNGRRVLEIIGKAPGAQGIILPEQMNPAITALERAVAQEEADHHAAIDEAQAAGRPLPQFEAIGLRQRVLPFTDMLRRCSAADKEIVWGV